MPAHVYSKIESLEKRPDGHVVKVEVDSTSIRPEIIKELEARKTGLATLIQTRSGTDVIDDIGLPEIKRFTKVVSSVKKPVDDAIIEDVGELVERKVYTVRVEHLFQD